MVFVIILLIGLLVDLGLSFFFGLRDLPCSFTEWLCYPFYFTIAHPFVSDGFGMFPSLMMRLGEVVAVILLVIILAA